MSNAVHGEKRTLTSQWLRGKGSNEIMLMHYTSQRTKQLHLKNTPLSTLIDSEQSVLISPVFNGGINALV